MIFICSQETLLQIKVLEAKWKINVQILKSPYKFNRLFNQKTNMLTQAVLW